MDFHSLSRRELQALCKKNKIPANITNLAMADALKALHTVEGLEDVLITEKPSVDSPAKTEIKQCVPRTSYKTSTRREPVKQEPQTKTRGGSRRAPSGKDEENTAPMDLVPGKMESELKEVTGIEKKVAMTSIRREPVKEEHQTTQISRRTRGGARKAPARKDEENTAPVDLVTRKMESQLNEAAEDEKKEAVTPAVITAVSRRRTGATSVKDAYNTRRSTRMLEKKLMGLNLDDVNDNQIVEKEAQVVEEPKGNGEAVVTGKEQEICKESDLHEKTEVSDKKHAALLQQKSEAVDESVDDKNVGAELLDESSDDKNVDAEVFDESVDDKNVDAELLDESSVDENVDAEAFDESVDDKNVDVELLDESSDDKNVDAGAFDESVDDKNVDAELLDESSDDKNVDAEAFDESVDDKNADAELLDESSDDKNVDADAFDDSVDDKNVDAELLDESSDDKNVDAEAFDENKGVFLDESSDDKNVDAEAIDESVDDKNVDVELLDELSDDKNVDAGTFDENKGEILDKSPDYKNADAEGIDESVGDKNVNAELLYESTNDKNVDAEAFDENKGYLKSGLNDDYVLENKEECFIDAKKPEAGSFGKLEIDQQVIATLVGEDKSEYDEDSSSQQLKNDEILALNEVETDSMNKDEPKPEESMIMVVTYEEVLSDNIETKSSKATQESNKLSDINKENLVKERVEEKVKLAATTDMSMRQLKKMLKQLLISDKNTNFKEDGNISKEVGKTRPALQPLSDNHSVE